MLLLQLMPPPLLLLLPPLLPPLLRPLLLLVRNGESVGSAAAMLALAILRIIAWSTLHVVAFAAATRPLAFPRIIAAILNRPCSSRGCNHEQRRSATVF